MEYFSTIVLVVLLVLIVRESRAGSQAVKSDPSVQLKPSERFRTLRMQMLEPQVALVVVGSLLVTDLEPLVRRYRRDESAALPTA